MTTVQSPPKSDMTAFGLTWSRAAKNMVHIRPKNTIPNRFLGKTCSSLSFHDAPGRTFSTGASFCVVVAICAQLGARSLLCVKCVQLRGGTLGPSALGSRQKRNASRKRKWKYIASPGLRVLPVVFSSKGLLAYGCRVRRRTRRHIACNPNPASSVLRTM